MYYNNVLQDLTEKFAVRIANMYKVLSRERGERTMSLQVYRSGTSIGANIAEGRDAQSKADYIGKLSIALKEANETQYWLKTLYESDYLSGREYESINNDCKIITGTLVNVIKKLKV